jgi:hypothetical protein
MNFRNGILSKNEFRPKFGNHAGASYQAVTAQLYERWSEKVVLSFEGKVKKHLKILSENPYLYQIIDNELQLRNV